MRTRLDSFANKWNDRDQAVRETAPELLVAVRDALVAISKGRRQKKK